MQSYPFTRIFTVHHLHAGPAERSTGSCSCLASRRPSGLRKTTITLNSLAHRTTWLRSDFGCSPRRPDAVISTTQCKAIRSLEFSRSIIYTLDPPKGRRALAVVWPYLRVKRFQGHPIVNKKRELFPGQLLASPRSLRVTAAYVTECRNINLPPFRHEGMPSRGVSPPTPLSLRANPCLRIDSLTIKCCSHETFLHFGLQGSLLNICYYHQDLH